MADKPWKQFERWIASLFTTTRNSLSGGNSKMSRSDSLHPDLFISCKYTRNNHKQLRDLLREERQKAEAEGKTAVLAIGEFNDRANTFLVVHIQDFEHLTGLIKDGKVVVSPQKRSQRKRT
jgi:hypothetical protein